MTLFNRISDDVYSVRLNCTMPLLSLPCVYWILLFLYQSVCLLICTSIYWFIHTVYKAYKYEYCTVWELQYSLCIFSMVNILPFLSYFQSVRVCTRPDGSQHAGLPWLWHFPSTSFDAIVFFKKKFQRTDPNCVLFVQWQAFCAFSLDGIIFAELFLLGPWLVFFNILCI